MKRSSIYRPFILTLGLLLALSSLAFIPADPPGKKKPYKEVEAHFSNGEAHLAGTLTIPKKKGRYPAIVLLSGSGPQDRDSKILGFREFKVIADHLSRRGMAVLRFDDRGVGESEGPAWDQADMKDFAGDALAAVHWLREREDIDPDKIGLLGHSEGGAIAPLAWSMDRDIAFLVLMAGTGASGEEVLLHQNRLIFESMGSDEAAITEQIDFVKAICLALRTGEGWEAIVEKKEADFRKTWDDAGVTTRTLMGDREKYAEKNTRDLLEPYRVPWFKNFLEYNPVPYLEQVTCPVLALWGGKDLQVDPAQNEPPMLAALEKVGNTQVKSITFPEANHLFLKAETGSPLEYQYLKKEFIPGFLDSLSTWISDLDL